MQKSQQLNMNTSLIFCLLSNWLKKDILVQWLVMLQAGYLIVKYFGFA